MTNLLARCRNGTQHCTGAVNRELYDYAEVQGAYNTIHLACTHAG